MIDFNILWSVVFAIALVRIVDTTVEYVHYRFTKKKRDKAFVQLLEELEAELPKKKPKKKTR